MSTAFAPDDFQLTLKDSICGDARWLLYRPSKTLDPTDLATSVECLFRTRVHPAELTVDGGELQFGPRTASWRTLARMAVVNTDVARNKLQSIAMAEAVTSSLLGPCLPADCTLRKPFDGFRGVAVAMSLHLDRIVTPCRARHMFDRTKHQGFELTPYGKDLLQRCQKTWPPCPENAALYIAADSSQGNKHNLLSQQPAASVAPCSEDPTISGPIIMIPAVALVLQQPGSVHQQIQGIPIIPVHRAAMHSSTNNLSTAVATGDASLDDGDETGSAASSTQRPSQNINSPAEIWNPALPPDHMRVIPSNTSREAAVY